MLGERPTPSVDVVYCQVGRRAAALATELISLHGSKPIATEPVVVVLLHIVPLRGVGIILEPPLDPFTVLGLPAVAAEPAVRGGAGKCYATALTCHEITNVAKPSSSEILDIPLPCDLRPASRTVPLPPAGRLVSGAASLTRARPKAMSSLPMGTRGTWFTPFHVGAGSGNDRAAIGTAQDPVLARFHHDSSNPLRLVRKHPAPRRIILQPEHKNKKGGRGPWPVGRREC